MEDYQHWLTQMMKAGLEARLLEPSDVLEHVTPEVLAEHLPPEVLAQVFEMSLSAGAMTPERILEIVSPDVLALHVPREVLWACIAGGARRAGLAEARTQVRN